MMIRDVPVRITLVHGTWGRVSLSRLLRLPTGRFWFEEGSNFVSSLRDDAAARGISICCGSFEWSGANSIRDREAASIRLADHLRNEHERFPSAVQLVIGHSHAGNIGLSAISLCHWGASEPMLATLSTPFVSVVPVPLSDFDREVFRYAAFGATGGTAVILLISSLEQLGLFPFLLCIMFAALVGGLLIELLFGEDLPRAIELARATRHTMSPPPVKMLVVRGVNDEAAVALTAGAIGNRLTGFAAWFLGYVMVLLMAVLQLAWMLPSWLSPGVGNNFRWPIYVFGAPTFALLLFGCCCKATHGRELMLRSLACTINARSVPRAEQGRISVVTLEALPGFRHSIYSHPSCADVIVEWIEAQLRSLEAETNVGAGRSKS